eukprot:jgi/Ulvmu1/9326/UM050_0076.1
MAAENSMNQCSKCSEPTSGTTVLATPKVDDWQYHILNLTNGIQALLISDPAADMAAAAMDVHVGSMQDPPELQGLAHFTEHMLFYASKKYPKEDEYSKFVSDHGGHTNAWTSAENTNYQFTVNWDALEKTLDRFAQFFISPLISPDGIARERQAVDSEHSKNLQSDVWRRQQLFHTAADPEHPFSRFFTGNMETLGTTPESQGIDVHAELLKFYNSEYSANRMKLCVLGRQSIQELQEMVVGLFSEVPNKQLPPRVPHPTEPYPPARRGKLITTVPVTEGHALRLQWPLPALLPHWREAPDGFLGHLIGHEGEGSLFASLKEQGWLRSLSAGGMQVIRGHDAFTVSMTLTDEGNAHVQEIVQRLFQYIALLRGPSGVTEPLYADNAALCRLRFDYREHPSAFNYVSSLANLMHDYPGESLLLVQHHVPLRFDEDITRGVLDALTTEDCSVMWASHCHTADGMDTEPWYKQPYSIKPLPEEWLKCWSAPGSHDSLALPAINPFTPSNLDMLPPETATDPYPKLLVQDDQLTLYHKTIVEFGAPKAVLRARLILPAAAGTSRATMATALLAALVADALNEVAYDAELAGLAWGVDAAYQSLVPGLDVRVSGYHDKLPVLLREVLARLAQLTVRPERFAIVKERFVLALRNWRAKQPYMWASRLLEQTIMNGTASIAENLAAVESLTAESLQLFADHTLFSSGCVEALALGNVSTDGATALGAALRGLLTARGTQPLDLSDIGAHRLVALPRGRVSVRMQGPNGDDDNSAHLTVFQMATQGALRTAALADITEHILHRDAFHALRTVQQIGYIVTTYVSLRAEVPHIAFLLQSTSVGAEEIGGRVDTFMAEWRRRLVEEMTDEDFEKSVEELAKNKLQKPKKLSTYAARWLPEVLLARECWDRVEQEVAELRQLRRADVVAFVDEQMLPAADGGCRKLCVHITGAAEATRSRGGDAGEESGRGGGEEGVEEGGGPEPEPVAEAGGMRRWSCWRRTWPSSACRSSCGRQLGSAGDSAVPGLSERCGSGV